MVTLRTVAAASIVFAFNAERAVAGGLPLILLVNTTVDLPDDNPGDGFCHTSAGTCSLRAAIMEYNHGGDLYVIAVLQSGTYSITLPPAGDNGEASGDMDIDATQDGSSRTLLISGAGAAATILDANGLDRFFYENEWASVVISNVTIRNGAIHGGSGGGIYAANTLRIVDSVVENNSAMGAGQAGGGICAMWTFSSSGTTFRANSADTGGGVYAGANAYFQDVTFYANTAVRDGGGLFQIQAAGTSTIEDSTFSANAAGRDGGGLFTANSGGDMRIMESTFSGNTANRNGGGIANVANAYVLGSTIVFNDADDDHDDVGGIGGGIFTPGAPFELVNSIVAGNTNQVFNSDDCNGSVISAGRNLVTEPLAEDCSVIGDPFGRITVSTLGPLQDNGGPTLTHALLAGSEAIDNTLAQVPCDMPLDQRGADRVVGIRCDVGAYEFGGMVELVFRNSFDE